MRLMLIFVAENALKASNILNQILSYFHRLKSAKETWNENNRKKPVRGFRTEVGKFTVFNRLTSSSNTYGSDCCFFYDNLGTLSKIHHFNSSIKTTYSMIEMPPNRSRSTISLTTTMKICCKLWKTFLRLSKCQWMLIISQIVAESGTAPAQIILHPW